MSRHEKPPILHGNQCDDLVKSPFPRPELFHHCASWAASPLTSLHVDEGRPSEDQLAALGLAPHEGLVLPSILLTAALKILLGVDHLRTTL
jgi:hypothetical protein